MGVSTGVDPKLADAFCARWKVAELALFGSILRDDFGPDSDVDVLVSFSPDAHWGLFDMVRMKEELERIVEREVHLVSKRGVESSRNYIRRREILNSAKVIHAG